MVLARFAEAITLRVRILNDQLWPMCCGSDREENARKVQGTWVADDVHESDSRPLSRNE